MDGAEGNSGKSYALIIAADRFQDGGLAQLRSPSRDAEELASVLKDPLIGGYEVRSLLNEPAHLVSEDIEALFADALPADLVLLYISSHGVKDQRGQLVFATTTTKLNRLQSTGIPADFVYEQVNRCRSRRIVVLLDCCYSGAYLRGHRPRGRDHVSLGPLEGRGWAVITSSTAMEYAFEIDADQITDKASGMRPGPSVFTAAIVTSQAPS
jgi:Caspase domain